MSERPIFERFRALGCLAVVGASDAKALPQVLDRVRAEIKACDLACSRFRADSELSSLNDPSRTCSESGVSPWLADALTTAIWVARQTEGLVDPTIGQCLVDLGYDRTFELLGPDRPLIVRATHVPAWERVSVRGQRARVPVGVRLDLGATAKALCADRASHDAGALAGCGVLVSLGGDVAVVGPSPEDGWAVHVTDRADTDPSAPSAGQTVAIRTGGLATSGITARRWSRGGRQQHHLVDPRTARPATEVWRTVSVAAPNCVEANLASTAAVILGRDAPMWLAGRHVHARLVTVEGGVVRVGDWPSEDSTQGPVTGRAQRSAALLGEAAA